MLLICTISGHKVDGGTSGIITCRSRCLDVLVHGTMVIVMCFLVMNCFDHGQKVLTSVIRLWRFCLCFAWPKQSPLFCNNLQIICSLKIIITTTVRAVFKILTNDPNGREFEQHLDILRIATDYVSLNQALRIQQELQIDKDDNRRTQYYNFTVVALVFYCQRNIVY